MKPDKPTSLLITAGLLVGSYLLSRIDFVVNGFGQISLSLFLVVGKFFFPDLTFEGEVIRTSRIEVLWTGDCSGMNLLLILLAIGAWLSREQTLNRSWVIRLLCLLPAAVLANVLRITALTGYRTIAYPMIESPQMHYFIGFLCVAPFALLALPGFRLHSLFLVLQTAAVMCLLAPHLDLEGGTPTALACVLLLGANRSTPDSKRLLMVLWLFSACAIFYLGIHSLWLPWIIAFPYSFRSRMKDLLLLPFTCSLLYIFPGVPTLSWIALALYAWRSFILDTREEKQSDSLATVPGVIGIASFSLPFLLPILFPVLSNGTNPPAFAATREIPGGFELRIPGQPRDIGLVWYQANGSERHHSLKTCLHYRGIELQDSKGSELHTDGEHWFREFFLVEGKLQSTHRDYVRATLGVRKCPGVHVIIAARRKSYEKARFEEKSANLMASLIKASSDDPASTSHFSHIDSSQR